jgi:hypothetical protein
MGLLTGASFWWIHTLSLQIGIGILNEARLLGYSNACPVSTVLYVFTFRLPAWPGLWYILLVSRVFEMFELSEKPQQLALLSQGLDTYRHGRPTCYLQAVRCGCQLGQDIVPMAWSKKVIAWIGDLGLELQAF